MQVRELKFKQYHELNRMVCLLTGSYDNASNWWLSPNAAFNMKYPYACEEDDVKCYLVQQLHK